MNKKAPEEFLGRGKGHFINCIDYDDAVQAIKDYHAQFTTLVDEKEIRKLALESEGEYSDALVTACKRGIRIGLSLNPSLKLSEKAEELWDDFSERIDSDIDSLNFFSGRDVITKEKFFKAVSIYKYGGESDAINFAEWVDKSDFQRTSVKEQWLNMEVEPWIYKTTAELYQLFKSKGN
jgi:hypothetical protein